MIVFIIFQQAANTGLNLQLTRSDQSHKLQTAEIFFRICEFI